MYLLKLINLLCYLDWIGGNQPESLEMMSEFVTQLYVSYSGEIVCNAQKTVKCCSDANYIHCCFPE